jgi:electron transfer flavoprotein beta subunit
MRIAVCAKQVPDPDIPPSQFKLDADARSVVPPRNVSPVVNGFDLNAVEAAVRLKEANGPDTEITIISVGAGFALDVMKRALATGADTLVLVDDAAARDLDAAATARVLAAAISHHGPFDMVLCGRQASDWDQAHVPLFLAESMDLPCVTVARQIEVSGMMATVQRVLPDGYQVVEVGLPAVISVSNELGEARYPALKGIMAASRKQPETHSLEDLGLAAEQLTGLVELIDLEIPQRHSRAEFIEGEDDAEKGRNLAVRLRQERLI